MSLLFILASRSWLLSLQFVVGNGDRVVKSSWFGPWLGGCLVVEIQFVLSTSTQSGVLPIVVLSAMEPRHSPPQFPQSCHGSLGLPQGPSPSPSSIPAPLRHVSTVHGSQHPILPDDEEAQARRTKSVS
ncbi:hypothetical protein QBC40DRAFT_97507 [Triangularia verruculosa]|uniref:Secreted protein n=1 Tax=Triangularia verruculosa TaxID=2587418 RepID=A0AAN7AZ66_9PEZI|nr:hypothetical protein QBC40DRAFT_97507 [Triangularia verruculosa]